MTDLAFSKRRINDSSDEPRTTQHFTESTEFIDMNITFYKFTKKEHKNEQNKISVWKIAQSKYNVQNISIPSINNG